MSKKLSEIDYKKYMMVVKSAVERTEEGIKDLPKHKQMLNLTYEEWVKYQNGDLKL